MTDHLSQTIFYTESDNFQLCCLCLSLGRDVSTWSHGTVATLITYLGQAC